MWASPSKIPTNISFTISGNMIKDLSDADRRLIPFVERTGITILEAKNNSGLRSNFYLNYP